MISSWLIKLIIGLWNVFFIIIIFIFYLSILLLLNINGTYKKDKMLKKRKKGATLSLARLAILAHSILLLALEFELYALAAFSPYYHTHILLNIFQSVICSFCYILAPTPTTSTGRHTGNNNICSCEGFLLHFLF